MSEVAADEPVKCHELAADAVDISLGDASTCGSDFCSPQPSPTKFGQAAVDDEVGSNFSEGSASAARRATQELEARNTRMARIAATTSIVTAGIAAVLSLSVGFADDSLTLIGFGVEAALDAFASVMVLWRFKEAKARTHEDAEAEARFKEVRDARRERNSGLGIGTTFMMVAVLLYISAIYKVTSWDANEDKHVAEARDGANFGLYVSMPMGLIFGGLAIWKLRLGKALDSQVLWKDGVCSALGAALALICGVAAILEEYSDSPEDMAKVDATASSLIATVLLVEGCRTIWHNLSGSWASQHRAMS